MSKRGLYSPVYEREKYVVTKMWQYLPGCEGRKYEVAKMRRYFPGYQGGKYGVAKSFVHWDVVDLQYKLNQQLLV